MIINKPFIRWLASLFGLLIDFYPPPLPVDQTDRNYGNILNKCEHLSQVV